MQKSKLKNILRYLIFLSITVALMYLAFKDVELGDLWSGMKRANYFWVAMSVLIGIASYLFRSLRWQILLEPLGYKPSLPNVYHALMVGYLTNLAVPRMGEITRCGVLNKTEKIPFDSLVGSVVLERIFDFLFLLLAVVIVMLVRIDFFGSFIYKNVLEPINISVVGMLHSTAAILLAALVIIIVVAILYLYRKQLDKIRFVGKFNSLLKGFLHGIKSGLKMKRRVAFVIYSALIMGCYWMMSYTMIFAIPETASLSVVDALFLFVLGGLGWAVPVQGGFGAFHIIVASGLTLYGIPFDSGIIFATISHEAQVLFMIILGFISLGFVFLKTNKRVISKNH